MIRSRRARAGIAARGTLRADHHPAPPEGTDILQKRLFTDSYRVFYDAAQLTPRSRARTISPRTTSPYCTSRCGGSTSTMCSRTAASSGASSHTLPGFDRGRTVPARQPHDRNAAGPVARAYAARPCCRAGAGHLPGDADVHGLASPAPRRSPAPLAAPAARTFGRALPRGRGEHAGAGLVACALKGQRIGRDHGPPTNSPSAESRMVTNTSSPGGSGAFAEQFRQPPKQRLLSACAAGVEHRDLDVDHVVAARRRRRR